MKVTILNLEIITYLSTILYIKKGHIIEMAINSNFKISEMDINRSSLKTSEHNSF